ncbi:hypothetical protein R3W88_033030 [Solanum pinnatisectum]|uniref:Uncharacterized protein n=1 Tax=Solanum pinnatisectum TaxID=50273 RepID=A0AAV9K275_9SOLN|nr:hypothetical protein R3W88_033030 [Solanum pinnatisectum]
MWLRRKMKCAWPLKHEAKIREIYLRKCSRRLSDLFWYSRKHDKRPLWIHEDIWKNLNEYWASPEFYKKYTVEKEAQTYDKNLRRRKKKRKGRKTGEREEKIGIFIPKNCRLQWNNVKSMSPIMMETIWTDCS